MYLIKKGGDGNGGKRKGTITLNPNETGGDCTLYPFGAAPFGS